MELKQVAAIGRREGSAGRKEELRHLLAIDSALSLKIEHLFNVSLTEHNVLNARIVILASVCQCNTVKNGSLL